MSYMVQTASNYVLYVPMWFQKKQNLYDLICLIRFKLPLTMFSMCLCGFKKIDE
jgi:hypothetical protein